MTLDDFAAAWVVHLRSVGIGDGGGEVANDGETGVLQTHRRVVGPFLGGDGILESCLFESHIPVFNALDEILAPLLGCCGVDVIDNLFLGFHQFATAHLGDVLLLGFQSPAGDGAHGFHLLLFVAVEGMSVGEVPHA